MQQLLLDLLPPPAPTFDNFITGQNDELIASLRGWLDDPHGATCFLLWGNRHSGRGHLAGALLAQQTAVGGAAQRPFFCKLCVDQLDEPEQTELFNVFNRLKLDGGRLLVSSLQPPAALPLREDLRTRLGSGLVYRVHALSDDEKRAALIARAKSCGMRLPDEVVDYLFRHVRRDMGTLTALVDALDRFTLIHKRALTLPLVRELLQHAMPLTHSPDDPPDDRTSQRCA